MLIQCKIFDHNHITRKKFLTCGSKCLTRHAPTTWLPRAYFRFCTSTLCFWHKLTCVYNLITFCLYRLIISPVCNLLRGTCAPDNFSKEILHRKTHEIVDWFWTLVEHYHCENIRQCDRPYTCRQFFITYAFFLSPFLPPHFSPGCFSLLKLSWWNWRDT